MFNNKLLLLFLFTISVNTTISAQQSLDIYGGFSKLMNNKFRLNSFENNSGNYNRTIDWEFGINGSLLMTDQVSNNIQLAFVGKKMGNHYLYARLTPGFQKAFALNTDTLVTVSDSVNVLNANLSYSEKFGFGYSYKLTDFITVGATFRYFEESYAEDNVYFHFSDSINSLVTIVDSWSKSHWRGDFGITFQPWDNLLLTLSSANLLILNQSGEFDKNNNLELRTNKVAILGIDYNPFGNFFLRTNFESTSSFIIGSDYFFKFPNGNIALGISVFHDKYQKEYFAGIQPSASFSYEAFSLNLSAILYSEERKSEMNVQNLLTDGIHNITNNQFSYNKISASLSLALNFKKKQKVKLIEINILSQIFPTMSEEYINTPFAKGKVLNLTDKPISVKPSSFCANINEEIINSPSVTIYPNDTTDISFYTVIADLNNDYKKNEIGNMSFYIATSQNEKEDESQKPILINNRNSWNSKVGDLRYFVKEDFAESNKYAKLILANHRLELKRSKNNELTFNQIKIMFNSFIKQMQYVSDPRSSSEFVQFPHETFEVKGGDCDDLSVAFAALLESIGIETAFVDYKSVSGLSHVNILVNTKLQPEESILISENDKKYFIRKNRQKVDEVWIPIEMTSLTNFKQAWKIGSEKFYKEAVADFGLSKGNVVIYDIY